MTEIAPLNNHADHQHGSASAYVPTSLAAATNGHSPAQEQTGEVEDSGVIDCFCGFNDDDGSTVLCELCGAWQHVQCYYPHEVVPEVHHCTSCKPRDLDTKSAAERQRLRQIGIMAMPGYRKTKKPPGKSHKKKIKETTQFVPQTNGWAVPEQAQIIDRTSGSPRDHPPPAKRPKTSHRSSSSTSALNHPSLPTSSRKRAGSVALTTQSPTKSPHSPTPNGYTGDYYTPEFMRLHRQPDCEPVQNNSYASIAVSDDLRTWLHDLDSLREVTNGLTQQNVFHRWDEPIEELEQTSPGFTKHTEPDTSMKVHGEHPVMQWLTADAPVEPNAYIGELKGVIGRVEDYRRDPSNRWDALNHPEPFVFFHDKLPIYIDCREEWTKLRYLRRSCQANVKMQIIIRGTDFHFCMVSMKDIAAGEELTIPWHIRGQREWQIVNALTTGSSISREDQAHMSNWFTGVLTNFGGCACGRSGSVCTLGRFDLRGNLQPSGMNGHSLKPSKPRKTKKGAAHISPLSTGRATNSRAGSEAVIHGEIEDDLADSHSVSNSSRSKPSSRDITPMGNVSDGTTGLGVEMSDRERRKLQQQERLFEKMEQGENGARKKRNSGGSALNTPSLTTSKQLGFPDSQNPSPTSVTSASKPRINGQSTVAARTVPNGVPVEPRSKPVYTEHATQTEPDKEEEPTALTLRRRAQGSYTQRLLRRVHEESRRRKERSVSVASQEHKLASSPVESKSEPVASPEVVSMPPPPVPAHPSDEPPPMVDSSTSPLVPDEAKDVEMEDVDDSAPQLSTITPTIEKKEPALDSPSSPIAENVPQSSHPPIQPPAPPWPVDEPTSPIKSPSSPRPTGLSLQLQPVPPFSSQIHTPTTPSPAVTPGSAITGNPVTQSPPPLTIIPPLFSPQIANMVAPSPMKKKLSLSDYTSRKKKNSALAQAQAQHNSSPSTPGFPAAASTQNESSSPAEEKAGVEIPSLKSSTSSVIEEVDMPLPRMGTPDSSTNPATAAISSTS